MAIKFINLNEVKDMVGTHEIFLCSLMHHEETLGNKIICNECSTCVIGVPSTLYLKDFNNFKELYKKGKEDIILLSTLL